MEKLSMCRVCLGEDIGMHSIVETHLQDVYESLVSVPFETKDCRPIVACQTCRARLQNCYNLKKRCLQSEELFKQMLSSAEVEPVKLQEIYNKVRREHQMSADNVGGPALTLYEVKIEKSDPEDIDEDALEDNSVYDNIQSAASEDGPLINVKEEQSGDRTSDPASKESEQAVRRNLEDLTSSNPKEHELAQDMFKELHKLTAADKTAATLNDGNKEISTSVPHSTNVQHACDTCQQWYTSKCKLEKHIRLCSDVWEKDLSRENSTSTEIHNGQKPYQCHVCKKHFSFTSELTRHIRTHTGEKPYNCDVCKKSFSVKCNLSKHMRTHTGEKPYHCNICKKQFAGNRNLSEHMRRHTGEKPYQCNICKKYFSVASYLIRHIRTHTGERPFHCDICKKQFSTKGNLSDHMRTHTGEKPYQCSVCKKYYSRASHLSVHIRTHTGEKPHQCYICKKQFVLKDYLNKHMRTHSVII